MKLILFTAIVISVSLACNTGKHAPTATSKKIMADPSELNGTWQLNYISGPRIAFDGLYPDKKPQITFDITASRVSGNTSCNSFSGPVSIDGSKISFNQPMALTKMFCPGEGEPIFLETLKKINFWAATDATTLNLITGDIAMMRFTKVK